MRYFLITLLFSFPSYACDLQPYFSPRGGAEKAIINEINQAKDTVAVAAYVFTSQPISLALEAAKIRGVIVATVVDGNASKQARAFLGTAKFPVRFNHQYKIQHSKYLIADSTTITGSFNFTKSAEVANSENILVIKNCPDVTLAYKENWSKLWTEAQSQ